jgi:hypothetical protein
MGLCVAVLSWTLIGRWFAGRRDLDVRGLEKSSFSGDSFVLT